MSETLELDDIQGLVVRGYGGFSAARFALLEIEDPGRVRAWLGGIAERLTPASSRPEEAALHLAFSADGLRKLGLPEETLALFSPEYVGGMTTPHRRRVLGDLEAGSPEGWQWGGPLSRPIDLLLLLYARDEAGLTALQDQLAAGFGEGGLAQVEQLETDQQDDREHFGFRDGISQPTIEGLARTDTAANTIRAGEFILGYQNQYGLYTDRPLVSAGADPSGLLPPASGDSGQRDLGRNGSYLVFRQLSQDVHGFWRFLDQRTRRPDGQSDEVARTWLAAKLVGRWPNGAPTTLSPNHDDPQLSEANDFGYGQNDLFGTGCPIGAHVRRAHPRDALDPEPGTDRSIELDKRHRILRRGRKYGPPVPPRERLNGGDGEPRGLHFICLCANIARQFEFVQQTWISSRKFDRLYDEVDPLIGRRDANGTTFTIPRRPVRQRINGIPSFVSVRGGGYFFLPGLRAVRYLASL
jgi:Dyp-type peroxidase family